MAGSSHGSNRNPFDDSLAIAAERLLLETVVGEYRDHPAIWMWNLGNDVDVFVWPESAAVGAGPGGARPVERLSATSIPTIR